MYQPMEENIPDTLKALMVVQEEAAPTTPQGLPTVAARLAQRARQQMQPQSQIPMQASQLSGVQEAAQQAGIAGPIIQQQQQQQQAQQIAQMAAQQIQQQMQPQQMARGGIAGLPAHNMARLASYSHGGGVMGFDGVTGSVVPDWESMSLDERKEYFKKINAQRAAEAAARGATAAESTAAAEGSGILSKFGGAGSTASTILKTLGRLTPAWALASELFYTSPEDIAILQAAEQKKRDAMPKTPEQRAAMAEVAHLRELHPEPFTPPREGFDSNVPVAAPVKPSAATTPRPSGIAGARPAPVNPDVERMRSMLSQAQEPIPSAEESLAKQQKLSEASRAKYGLTGNIGSASEQAIANAAARDEALRAKYEAGKEGRGIENLISAFAAARSGLGALGQRYVDLTGAQKSADLQFEQLMNASAAKRDEMNILLQNAREAAARGDVDRANADLLQAKKAKAESDHYRMTAGASLAHTTVSAQTEEKKIASQAADRAAHERSQEQMRTMALLENINKDIGLNKEKLKNEMISKMDVAQKQALLMGELEGAKPEDKLKAQNIRAEIDRQAEAAIQPQKQHREMLLNKLGMGQWGQLTVSPSR